MTRDNLLGEFLQARRARVRPSEAGLAGYGRRRVPGLRRDEIKRFNHPDAGHLSLRRQTLTVAGAEDLVIIVYQPEPGSASADALTRFR
ncbi:hypothetical protein [Amycolatopsis nigrescens]|uniref:MmyB family transcriptional regulator n=1 Tax=Amycolatopsis nigrescens TaxID=381445 RepID=UPI000A02D45C|nr:hypothetical protein [Amycolatopsis nigrescens]